MRICEFFHSIEGEGLWTGIHSSVLRLSGCNLKCKFCDTKFSSWWSEDVEEIIPEGAFKRIQSHSTSHVSITGGEPFFRSEEELRELKKLTDLLLEDGYNIKFETNATIFPELFKEYFDFNSRVFWSLSPKLDGMGQSQLNLEVISRYVHEVRERDYCESESSVQLKFVVGSRLKDSTMEVDLSSIKSVIRAIPEIEIVDLPIILQPEGLTENIQEYALRYAILAERMTFDNTIDPEFWRDINFRVMPQVHRIAWMNGRQR